MKILAFAASNSRQSINRTLAAYVAALIEGAQVEVLDIADYEMPIFSIDREQALGHPALAREFLAKIGEADALVISYAEHNGSYTAAYKNLFDWMSRITREVFQNRPTLLLATSPGPGGAANVLAAAKSSAPHFAADVRAAVSVPSFHDNFDIASNLVSDTKLRQALQEGVRLLLGTAG